MSAYSVAWVAFTCPTPTYPQNLFGSRSEKLACSLKFHFTKDFLEADTGGVRG